MTKWGCADPRLRRLFLVLLVLAVLLAALFLYVVGLKAQAGLLYALAVLLLLGFALAGAIALAFLALRCSGAGAPCAVSHRRVRARGRTPARLRSTCRRRSTSVPTR